MFDIYISFIQKCFSLFKYVNCHFASWFLTPALTTVLTKFQYLHFSVALRCCSLHSERLNMEQSCHFVLQKETVPHPETSEAPSLGIVPWNSKHLQAPSCNRQEAKC